MSHVGADKLRDVTAENVEKTRREFERRYSALQPRPSRAIIRKTVVEFRRIARSKEIDFTSTTSVMWETQVETHAERVRRETWWIFAIALYSREIIDESNL